MAPYSTLAPSEEEKKDSEPTSYPRTRRLARLEMSPHPPEHALFEEALLEMSKTRPGRRTLDFVTSLAVHILLIATFILIPLYYTEAIDLKQFTQTWGEPLRWHNFFGHSFRFHKGVLASPSRRRGLGKGTALESLSPAAL